MIFWLTDFAQRKLGFVYGQRVSITLLAGMTQDDIMRDYIELEREDIKAALRSVSDRESKTPPIF